jgi:hypothetical protein
MVEVLADQDNPVLWDRAAGLWDAQFDHPYDGAYCECWNGLPSGDRKALQIMAAKSGDNDSMFAPSLIGEIASHSDPAAGPIIERWTALPPKKNAFFQDSIRKFEIAHAALARLRCPLPDRSAEALSAADHALLACGRILYWLNRDDLPLSERKLSCAAPLAILLRHENGVAAAVAGEFFRSDHMFSESARQLPGLEPAVTSFGKFFPVEVAAIYRAALEKPTTQSGYFEFFRIEDVIEKALINLGWYGSTTDIPLLRVWSNYPRLGPFAIQAIKEIEESSTQHQLRAKG